MRVFMLIMTVMLAFTSCSKSLEDLPECIQLKISESKVQSIAPLRGVYIFSKDGDDFYWFNTGAVEFDGSEKIYNEHCEEVCDYCGFCIPPKCLEDFPDYGSDKWESVWKP